MDTKTESAPNRAYEDFEPNFQWERNERTATLILLLPGFRREQLRVQVTSTPVLKITGEQLISENKWRRVNKEFPVPSDCNVDEVTAKFEQGRLYVKLPIVIPQRAPKPEEAPPKANEVSEEKLERPQKEKELPKEEGKEEEKKKVGTSGVVETAEATASKVEGEEKRLGSQGLIKRTKTRILDYTISLRPTYEEYKNTLGELKKPNKMMNPILVILFVVALGIYVKNAFRSFLGGSSKFQD